MQTKPLQSVQKCRALPKTQEKKRVFLKIGEKNEIEVSFTEVNSEKWKKKV